MNKINGFLLYDLHELPRFGDDKSEHVYNRIIIVKCGNIIPDKTHDESFSEQHKKLERGF